MKIAKNPFFQVLTFLKRKISPSVFSVFFILCGLEAVWVFIYIAGLPADPKNSLFFGFSLQRSLILGGVLLYFLISIFGLLLGIRKKNNPIFISTIKIVSSKKVFFSIFFICAIALFVLLIPESGLRGQYQAVFEKTDPIFFLIFLYNFQLASLLSFLYIKTLDPDESKTFYKNAFFRYLLPAAVFLFPFLFFFPRTIPINGEFYGVANDFIPTSYSYKVYLLDNLSHFHFPLWSPSEAAGFPFFSNPFAQAFYPLNIPQTFIYFINGGYSILDHQRFAVLGIAIFALGLYFWLKEFSLSTRSVFIASLIIPVSFRLAELIRYPSGLHSAAWYPWILLSLTKISSSKTIKSTLTYALVLLFSCFCLVTGGYQYYLYYSLFLFIPYLIILWFPLIRRAFFQNALNFNKRNLFPLSITGILVLIISSPYILHLVRLLSLTTARGGDDFSFSANKNFTFIDTLGSLVYPPSSQTEGWYYFSIPCLMVIFFYFLPRHQFRKSVSEGKDQIEGSGFWFDKVSIKIILLGWIVVISYLSYGSETALFGFLWKYLPYFSHMRFLGRLNIVLIPLIGLLLAISIDSFYEYIKSISNGPSLHKDRVTKFALSFTGIYFCLLAIQIYLISNNEIDRYWNQFFYIFSDNKFYFILSGIIAFLFFLFGLYIFFKSKRGDRRLASLWTVLFVCISLADLWHVGAFMWWNGTLKANEDARKVIDIPNRILKEAMNYKRDDSFLPPSVMLSPIYNVSFGFDWYFESYKSFYQNHDFEPASRKELLGVTSGNRIFFTKTISHKTISDFIEDSNQQIQPYEIVEFSGEKLRLTLTNSEDGYISYIDNWDSDWKGYINNKEVPVEKLFSTFKSIKVRKGDWDVLFSYEPAIFPDFNLFSLKKD